MLLTAKLFRSTSRSFKAFPSNRLGSENANTLISTETKSRNNKETESVCAEVTPSYPGMTCHQQLEVNTSNLKFRKFKSKKKEYEQEVESEVVPGECPKEEPALKKSSIEELSKLFLGESKSDFEQWLEGSCSIQTANKINSVHEIKNSCDQQYSIISSCYASDCSEEDKEDKAGMTLVSEWNENKFCETSDKITCAGEVDSRIQRSSYSSGCHSMTASSSSVVSDSEGASPSCSSPHQDVFTLQNELNLKMVDLPTAHTTTGNDSVFKLPEVESQFQIVQSKKKMKLKSRSGKVNNFDKSASISFNNLSIDKVLGDSNKQSKNHSIHANGLGDNSQTEVVDLQPPISVSRPHLDVIPQLNVTESCAPKYISSSGVKPGIYTTTLRGDLLNVDKEVKKVKQGKKGQKIVSGNRGHFHVTQKDMISSEKLQSSADSETVKTLSKSSCSLKAEVLIRKSDDSNLTLGTDSMTRIESGVISFGLGCKDLDTFSSPLSMPVKCQHESIERRKDNVAQSVDRHVSKSNKQRFDLRQAQKFLMKAYDAVQKQKNEDSNSVFVYS